MDWNGNFRNFVSVTRPESSFDFLYHYNYDQYPGMEMKHAATAEKSIGLINPAAAAAMEKNSNNIFNYGSQEKKKRLTSDQLESLERSFQEEIKLDPDRKMKLSRELGLQPRQIAVWFQNRRARWKSKQLELLYDALKQDFDLVSREKQKLQEEVIKLKSMLREHAGTRNKQVSTGITEVSGEETVESTTVAAVRNSNIKPRSVVNHQIAADCSYIFNVDDYNPAAAVSSPFWCTVLPATYQ